MRCILQPLQAVHPHIGNDQVTAITAYLVDAQLIGGLFNSGSKATVLLQFKDAALYRGNSSIRE